MKMIALFVIAFSLLSTNVYAAANCQLKNLKNKQTRDADGTAYSPKSTTSKSSDNITSGTVNYSK
jgi:hypothetical protein